jgi:hypothetical protein
MNPIRYLYNRNQEYMTTPKDKQQEDKIINHILQVNKYNTLPKMKEKKRKNQEDTHNNITPKWAKFTYTDRETHIITKLFRHTDLWIAYKTNNNLRKLLTSRRNVQDTDIYNHSGAYQLTCTTCNKKYIGQTALSKHISKSTNRIISTTEENHFTPNIYPKTITHSHP